VWTVAASEARPGGPPGRVPTPVALTGLRAARGSGQVVAHFQPQVRLATGALAGLEALVRWHHPERGLLLPGAFLPAVQRTALLTALTGEVLAQAARRGARAWQDGGRVTMAVNISPRTLLDPALPDLVEDALAASGLPAHALVLEITEEAMVEDSQRATAALHRLTSAGVQISLDDYGVGWSQLHTLRRLPLHEVKIDRSFTADLQHDRRARLVVASTIDLAHTLGLRVVAEGIEDGPTAALLLGRGCDVGQGWYFGRPSPDGTPAVHPSPTTATASSQG
jgi:EAL domain-containing protein (putative c-di-GMP-specific phosphodiesterase class I)